MIATGVIHDLYLYSSLLRFPRDMPDHLFNDDILDRVLPCRVRIFPIGQLTIGPSFASAGGSALQQYNTARCSARSWVARSHVGHLKHV